MGCCGRSPSSFGWCASVRAHRGVRTTAEARDARPGKVSWRWFEVPRFDPRDCLNDDGPAALEVLRGQRFLAVLLQPGRPADAEDVLAHAAPHPVLRIPKRKESRLKAKRGS